LRCRFALRWGASELVARLSHLDLNGGVVQGAKVDMVYLGVNPWAKLRWRLGFGWG
jgi:Phosphate-selective porin O and P